MFGRRKRDDRYDQYGPGSSAWNEHYYRGGIMPYGLTPGQTFDALDTGNTLFRGSAGQGFGMSMLAFAGLDVAISAGSAPPENIAGRAGGALAAQASGIASWYLGGPIGTVGGGILGGALGGFLGGPEGAILGARAGSFVGKWATKIGLGFAIDPFVRRIGSPINRLVGMAKHQVNFGQGFTDSEPAYTMRQKGMQEMQASLLNAYQYLGREAQLMHQ